MLLSTINTHKTINKSCKIVLFDKNGAVWLLSGGTMSWEAASESSVKHVVFFFFLAILGFSKLHWSRFNKSNISFHRLSRQSGTVHKTPVNQAYHPWNYPEANSRDWLTLLLNLIRSFNASVGFSIHRYDISVIMIAVIAAKTVLPFICFIKSNNLITK